MNHKKLQPQTIGWALVILLLVGCGKHQPTSPTATSTPAPTPTNTTVPTQAPMLIDRELWKKIKLPAAAEAVCERDEYDLVVASDGSVDVFHGGYAILAIPKGADLEAHLKEAGLELADAGPRGETLLKVRFSDPALERLIRTRRDERGIGQREIPGKYDWAIVRLDLSNIDVERLDEYMRKEKISGAIVSVSSERALKTLAAIADHRLRFGDRGFGLMLNLATFPSQSALARSTTEGLNSYETDYGSRDPSNDPYWTITRIPEAWQLSQVSEVNMNAVVLAIIDTGFATTDTELFPISIVTREGDDIGGAGYRDYHGTKVSSVAAAPVNDQLGAAGTSIRSFGTTGIQTLDHGGTTFLMWLEMWDLKVTTLAQLIFAAVDEGADVINYSGGHYCNPGCQFLGDWNGITYLGSALAYAHSMGVPLIVGAGNDRENLDSKNFLPCEAWGGGGSEEWSVCVGGIYRDGTNAYNYGGDVDIWAPGKGVWVGPIPSNPNPHQVSGTSYATPYVAGIVAMATAMHGSPISNNEIKDALQATASSSGDSKVDGIVNAYAFLRQHAKVVKDFREPNNDYLSGGWWDPRGVDPDELLTLAYDIFGYPIEDIDWLPFDDVPDCGTLQFDIDLIPDPSLGDISFYSHWGSPAGSGIPINDHTRRIRIERVGRLVWPPNRYRFGIEASGDLVTGYSITNILKIPNTNPVEGSAYPSTCDGTDNDCDGEVDEEFTDTDGDGMADCVDPDDDNDCVLDSNDNCPLVRNASQYCSEANSSDQSCGVQCLEFSEDPADYQGLNIALIECFKNTPIDPRCFVDGCPFPEPLTQPDVALVIASAMQILEDDQLQQAPLSPAIRRELATLSKVQVFEDGRILLPPDLKPDSTGVPRFVFSLPIMGTQPTIWCKPITLYKDIIRRVSTMLCIKTAGEYCQLDRDNDGIGDACDPNPSTPD